MHELEEKMKRSIEPDIKRLEDSIKSTDGQVEQ
jgi:hypothetical protein